MERWLSARVRHPSLRWNFVRSALLTLIVAAGVTFACVLSGVAQTSTPAGTFDRSSNQPLRGSSSFDHATTGFLLTNSHGQAACESCHIAGRFKNTPRQCYGCHNGAITAGKSQNHPPTTNKCEGCHRTTLFTDIGVIDHTQASIFCGACQRPSLLAVSSEIDDEARFDENAFNPVSQGGVIFDHQNTDVSLPSNLRNCAATRRRRRKMATQGSWAIALIQALLLSS